jgi:hypothetical protein
MRLLLTSCGVFYLTLIEDLATQENANVSSTNSSQPDPHGPTKFLEASGLIPSRSPIYNRFQGDTGQNGTGPHGAGSEVVPWTR